MEIPKPAATGHSGGRNFAPGLSGPPATAMQPGRPAFAALSHSSSKGSLASTMSSSSSRNREKQRSFDLAKVVETVFQLFVSEYGSKHDIGIPVRFYDFYGSPLMLAMLSNCIEYFKTYVDILKIVKRKQGSDPKRSSMIGAASARLFDPTKSPEELLRHAREEQTRLLLAVSKSYTKILLTCSYFENSRDDMLFFECIYHFTYLILRQSIDPKPFVAQKFWTRLKSEMCFVFRGKHFRREARRPASSSESSKERQGGSTQGRSGAAMGSTAHGHGQPASFRANGRLTMQPELEMPDNEKIGVESIFRYIKDSRTNPDAVHHDIAIEPETRSHPYEIRLVKREGAKKKSEKFSVYEAINARSPVVSFLLPQSKSRYSSKQNS